MRRFSLILTVAVMLIAATPALAEEEAKPVVATNYMISVQPSQVMAYEEAHKAHMQWHRDQNDSWSWHTWQIMTGKHMGQYIVRTSGHTWADYDAHGEFDADDGAHYMQTVAGHVQSWASQMVVSQPDISHWPEDTAFPKMVDVTVFNVKNESIRTFHHAIKKLHGAIQEKEIPFTYGWSMVASGAEGPTMILVFPYGSWAEYGAEMETPFWKMVEEVYGDFETQMLRKMISKSVNHQENHMAMFRKDLSYEPAE